MGTEVIEEWNLMRFHFVQARCREVESIPTPSIDLTSCRSPENLIEHHIRLRKRKTYEYADEK